MGSLEETWVYIVYGKSIFLLLAVLGVGMVLETAFFGRTKKISWKDDYGRVGTTYANTHEPHLFWFIFAGIFTTLSIVGFAIAP